MRRLAALALLALLALVFAAMPASAAPQHPLGNFTVNHYDGLHLYADRVEDLSVIDAAEIPTLQAKPAVDTDHNGQVSAAEAAAYAAGRCRSLAAALRLTVGGRPVALSVQRSAFGYRPGAVGLQTSRLTCDLSSAASLGSDTAVDFRDDFDSAGVGWHETTAVGTGVALVDSPLPAASVSDELLHYPNDLLASPLDVRGGSLSVRPGSGSSYHGGFHVSGSNVFSRALNHVNTTFNGLVGRQRLTLGVGALALLLALLLGAGHALLPGHGKTIMAAYLVGRRGKLRDVVAVGTTVTVTHTAGVLVLGLAISASSAFEPASAERWLGVSSGLLVVGVGLALVRSALARRRAGSAVGALLLADPPLDLLAVPAAAHGHSHEQVHARAAVAELAPAAPAGSVITADLAIPAVHQHLPGHSHDPAHGHDHGPSHSDGPDHSHDHGAGHSHASNHSHSHGPGAGHSHGWGGHAHGDKPLSRSSIVGLGIAGGLVPSPSALVVLLGTIALGRTAFGVLLVIAYGFGLALTLTLAGVLLVPLRNRAERLRGGTRLRRLAPYLDALPVLTAVLVIGVGVLLAVRSLTLF